MDRFAACKYLHDDYGLPVIVVGKDPGAEMWKRAVDAEADCYLRKPFSHLELAARVRAILRRYKGRQGDRKKESGTAT